MENSVSVGFGQESRREIKWISEMGRQRMGGWMDGQIDDISVKQSPLFNNQINSGFTTRSPVTFGTSHSGLGSGFPVCSQTPL